MWEVGIHGHAMACIWQSVENLQELVLSFYHWVLGNELRFTSLVISTFICQAISLARIVFQNKKILSSKMFFSL